MKRKILVTCIGMLAVAAFVLPGIAAADEAVVYKLTLAVAGGVPGTSCFVVENEATASSCFITNAAEDWTMFTACPGDSIYAGCQGGRVDNPYGYRVEWEGPGSSGETDAEIRIYDANPQDPSAGADVMWCVGVKEGNSIYSCEASWWDINNFVVVKSSTCGLEFRNQGFCTQAQEFAGSGHAKGGYKD